MSIKWKREVDGILSASVNDVLALIVIRRNDIDAYQWTVATFGGKVITHSLEPVEDAAQASAIEEARLIVSRMAATLNG